MKDKDNKTPAYCYNFQIFIIIVFTILNEVIVMNEKHFTYGTV